MHPELNELNIKSKLRCPHCGQLTDSLKCLYLEQSTFFGTVILAEEEHIACKKCVRSILLRHCRAQFLSANLFLPIVVIQCFGSYLWSLRPGHSQPVRQYLQTLKTGLSVKMPPETALLHAICSSIGGVFYGVVAGVAGGAVSYLAFRDPHNPSSNVSGDIGAVVAVTLVSLGVLAGVKNHRLVFFWSLIGGLSWAAARWVGQTYWHWDIGGTVLAWAFAGAVTGVLPMTRCALNPSEFLELQKERDARFAFFVLVLRSVAKVIPPLQHSILGGIFGGAFGAGLGFLIIGKFGFQEWNASLLAGLLGAGAAAVAGAFAFRSERRPIAKLDVTKDDF